MIRKPLLLLSLLLPASVSAETPFHWLAGSWCSQNDGAIIEEHWLMPSANRLLAINRTLVDGNTRAFEFLQISLDGDKAVYLAQPGGRPATAFEQADRGERWVRFENLQHDFPQFIEYRRQGDVLSATIGGQMGEEQQAFSSTFEPCSG